MAGVKFEELNQDDSVRAEKLETFDTAPQARAHFMRWTTGRHTDVERIRPGQAILTWRDYGDGAPRQRTRITIET